ncbi:hypothetical protein KJ693_10355 [bacterium]|nr:hypothetical protein [bacterium]MBU1615690.1 hypothetical protein [bacterium]
MQLIEVGVDKKLELPENILRNFQARDKFIVFTNKETILLKKVTIPRATSIAKRLQDPKGEMPMEEIVKAVHQCRKEKRQEGV